MQQLRKKKFLIFQVESYENILVDYWNDQIGFVVQRYSCIKLHSVCTESIVYLQKLVFRVMELMKSAKQYVNKKTEGTSVQGLAVGGIISFAGLYCVNKWYKQWRLQQNLRAFEEQSIAEDKIIVHMTPCWDLSLHPSPFVARVLTFLEKNQIPYIVDTTMPMHFYTQKMPWITYKRHHQPDSSLIIDWIKTQPDFGYLDMDKHLDEKQVSTSTAFKSMIDDGLTPVIMVRRLKLPENVTVYGELLFGTMGMAPWKGRLMMKMMSGKLKERMWINGMSFSDCFNDILLCAVVSVFPQIGGEIGC